MAPNSPEARSFLGLIHLTQGNFAAGWEEYEDRRRTAQFLREHRVFRQPTWKGEPLNGARILLYAEQGLGDTLHFVRYVPLVAARGGQVILEVPPRLHRLLAATPGAHQVIAAGDALPDFMSMPAAQFTPGFRHGLAIDPGRDSLCPRGACPDGNVEAANAAERRCASAWRGVAAPCTPTMPGVPSPSSNLHRSPVWKAPHSTRCRWELRRTRSSNGGTPHPWLT